LIFVQDTAFNNLTDTEGGNGPWKVGMRLEAKDRKNPHICAIANISKSFSN